MGITAWVSTNKIGVSNWLFFFRVVGLNHADSTGMRWRVKTLAWHHPLLSRLATSCQHRDSEAWVQALWALTADRFLTPSSQYTAFLPLGQFFPAKGMMEQVLQIKGETQPVKKILPGLSGFIPFSWLNFIFLVPSRTALGLLQPAPCRPYQGLQRNHEGSGQMGYNLQKLGPSPSNPQYGM